MMKYMIFCPMYKIIILESSMENWQQGQLCYDFSRSITLTVPWMTHTGLSDCWLPYAYPLLRYFLIAVAFYVQLLTQLWRDLFVLVSLLFGDAWFPFMYISALLRALGTPSEFSSVPILVADELVLPLLVNHDPRANTLRRTFLSPERLPCSRDLVIRVTTTRNKLYVWRRKGLR